ncbi:MAG: hypothetical protein GXZ13_04390 [Synergistaceae bacterium]|nr:hypothetical protein [Synergistaceae bacterium]
MEKMINSENEILNMLGLARRAGELIIGQDDVFAQIRKGKKLFILLANNASKIIQRKVVTVSERNNLTYIALQNTGRKIIGERLGIKEVQIAALPADGGLAKKILILYDRSDVDE